MDTLIFDKKQNIVYLSILALMILNVNYHNLVYFDFIWILYILLTGNILRIPKNRIDFKCVRYILYSILCYITLFLNSMKVNLNFNFNEEFCAFLFGMIILLLERNKYRLMINKQFILSIPKKEINEYILKIIQIVYATVGEELLFRCYIMTLPIPMLIKCSISVIYFCLYHYITPWGNLFNSRDLLNQIIVSLLSIILFLYTNSIVPSIILHLTINSIPILINFKGFLYHYCLNISEVDEDEELF